VETKQSVGALVRRATDGLPFHLALAALVIASFGQLPEVAQARGVRPYVSEATILLLGVGIGAWYLRARQLARTGGVPLRYVFGEAVDPGLARPLLPLLAYVLVVVAGILYSHDPTRSVDEAKYVLLSTILVVVVVLLVTSPQRLHIAAWAIVAMGMLVALVNLHQHFTGGFDRDYLGLARPLREPLFGTYQIGGPFVDPNFLAQRLLVVVPVGVWLFRVSRLIILKLVAVAAAMFCAFAVFVTGSRGGVVALSIMTVLLIGSMVPRRYRALAGVILILAFALALLPARSRETAGSIWNSATSLFSPGPDATGRAREWTVGFAMFEDHPVAGVGAGNFPARYLEYAAETRADLRPEERSAHSIPLAVATETGILGLAAFGAVLFVAFGSLRRARRRLADTASARIIEAFMIGLVGYLTAGFFLDLAYPRFFWVLIAVAFGCSQIEPSASADAFSPATTRSPT
jgi:O-antigen ligase